MSFSMVPKLGAGSKLYFENPAAPGAWLLLDNVLGFGQTGAQGEFLNVTPISKTVDEFIRGRKTPPSKQFTFNHVPGIANYQLYLSVVDDEDNVASIKHRIDYSTGDRAEFVVVANGRVMDESEGGTQAKMIVFGQQSGSAVWSEY